MSDATTVDTTKPQLLTTPCWWVDRGDCWEIIHFPTREEAEDRHVKDVREDEGFPLSVQGVFEVSPAELVQETECCYALDCPECGDRCHQTELIAECGWCGAPINIAALLGGAA